MRRRGPWWLLCGVSLLLTVQQPACSFDASGLSFNTSDGPHDAPPSVDGPKADAPLPIGDGLTCKPGLARCGAVCVDLKADPAHCGKCNAPCALPAADSCVNGSCSCGGGVPCAAGLDCQNGLCQCVVGGSCAGCCQGGSCALPANQSASRCGKGGQPCLVCPTTTPCALSSCSAGVCTHTPQADGVTCDDGKFCTVGDQCTGGACVGAPRDCKAQIVNLACGAAFCNEATKTCGAICQGGTCGPKGYCGKAGSSGCKCFSY